MQYVIIGAGGWAREIATIIKDNNDVVGFYDEVPLYFGESINNIPVVPLLTRDRSSIVGKYYIIGLGDVNKRQQIYLAHNDIMVSGKVVSKRSFLGRVKVDEGVVIFPHCFITDNVKIGKHSHIGEDVFIGHDVQIRDFCHILHGTKIGGRVKFGDKVFVGMGAVIRDGIKIGGNSIIGMGSVVTKDIPANVVAYGNPCKVVKKNEP